MTICIFGAGAVAGVAAARMARAGTEGLSIVARGDHLDAIRQKGLAVHDETGTWTVSVSATDDTAALGPQDVVVLGLKAHTIAAALPQIAPLIGPDTVIVSMLNGIPWWYFHGLSGDWPKRHLDSVDPGARIWNALGPERALGCVVYIAANIPQPGTIEHNNGGLYVIGEPNGSRSERLRRVAGLFEAGGVDCGINENIRDEVWKKLWGNLAINPVSVICEATCDDLANDRGVAETMAEMMREAFRVARAFGCETAPDVEDRLQAMRDLGPIETSMLQDFRAGKTIELDAILGVICELGRMAGIETPRSDLVYALARFKAAQAGCYAPPV